MIEQQTNLLNNKNRQDMTNLKNSYYPSSNLLPTLLNDFFADDFYSKANYNKKKMNSLPFVNLSNHEDHYLIELVAAGFQKSDFNIEFEDNKLSISAEAKKVEDAEKVNYSYKEFNHNSFQRVFTVNEKEVNLDAITAQYEAGILYVKLPKQQKEIAKRKIDIA